jgi:putative acetyltransferase
MNRPDAPATPADRPATDARLNVRRARVCDAEAFARTLSHPEVYAQVLQLPYGDADQWRARLTESCALGRADVILVAEAGDGMVGCAGLHPTANPSPRRRHVMELGIHVDPAWQGRGVGRLLMQSLCDLADRWLGLLRVELTVYADNHRAQALYRRFGFVEEGRHRAFALRDGEYVDAFAMARLNPQPLRGFPQA